MSITVFRKNADALTVALSQILVHDVVGSASNPMVLQYAKDLAAEFPTNQFYRDYKNDDTSWCALFVNWVLLQIGVIGTGKLNARSFIDFGEDVVGDPQPGDICVFWREDPKSWKGHVAFYLNEVERNGKKYIRLLGGNQGDEVKVIEYPASQLLDVRRITA